MSHSPGCFLVSPPGPRMDACSDVEYPLSEAQVPFKSGPQRLLVMLGREAHPYCVARHLSGGLFPGADVTRHPGLGAEDIRAWLSHRAGGQVQDQSTGHASPPPTSPSSWCLPEAFPGLWAPRCSPSTVSLCPFLPKVLRPRAALTCRHPLRGVGGQVLCGSRWVEQLARGHTPAVCARPGPIHLRAQGSGSGRNAMAWREVQRQGLTG